MTWAVLKAERAKTAAQKLLRLIRNTGSP
jgi:hypothetical protein